ncbi:MAG: hypothetical protein ACR2PI_15920, partial [Hyphomicrobiaceae bacterium]
WADHVYSLVAFATDLPEDKRTDRVIAEAWDTSYVLFDGVPDDDDLDRLAANAPRQEAGRFDERDLILSRANKSVRLFSHVIERLASGRQPDIDQVRGIGYLMRTTAVYGNGKFGIADRGVIAGRPGLDGPFAAEMLLVWLIRGFTHDLVEHVAERRNPERFVPLDKELKRFLGIGNATGLGMAPFLVSHPILLHNWIMARETALARVRALETASAETKARAQQLLARMERHLAQWSVDDERQMHRIATLRCEMPDFRAGLDDAFWQAQYPWQRLLERAQRYSLECQELIVALVLEPHGDLVDDVVATMSSDVEPRLLPAMRVAELARHLKAAFGFALDIDFADKAETAQFWYVSEEKLEPRLGLRDEEDGAELEMPLDIARQVQALARDLAATDQGETVAAFLLRHPEHRYAVTRVQTAASHPYSEIRDNLIARTCLPIDMLRLKLSFFGASKFDPRSDRWTRITLYQGAPLFDELQPGTADDWWMPTLDKAS